MPDVLYHRVSTYVDKTHLRGRLVYYRVYGNAAPHRPPIHDADLLWRKLQVRGGNANTLWLENELARRFDYHCCGDLSDFRRHTKAITLHGQIKSGGVRHEKDDRHRLDDPTRYILGWDNREKIATLKQERDQVASEGRGYLAEVGRLGEEIKVIQQRRDNLRDLLKFERFAKIDWRGVAERIDGLERERKEIVSSNDTLRTLREQLGEVETELSAKEQVLESLRDECARLRARIEQDELSLAEAQRIAAQDVPGDREALFAELEQMRPQALGEKQLRTCTRSHFTPASACEP